MTDLDLYEMDTGRCTVRLPLVVKLDPKAIDLIARECHGEAIYTGLPLATLGGRVGTAQRVRFGVT